MRAYKRLFLSAFCLFLLSCQARLDAPLKKLRNYTTPTRLITEQEIPIFEDDLDFQLLDVAIQKQLDRYKSKDLSGKIQLGKTNYPLKGVVRTLEDFLDLVNRTKLCLSDKKSIWSQTPCYIEFNEELRERYNFYVPDLEPKDPRYGEDKPVFFTGYYTPLIPASRAPTKDMPYAIYKLPENKSLAQSTREEIDFKGKLKNKGLELFYAPDLFELYLLHVEGGGKIEVQEKGKTSSYYLSYSGTNKQKWVFISKYMKEQGMIDNGSIAAQRKYLSRHPERAEEIYSTCPSYVYFKITDHPPLGNDGVTLTDGRSIATDRRLYAFKGLLAFIKSKRLKESYKKEPKENDDDKLPFEDYSRFYLDQDTGGAITGKGRVDIYFGEGDYARRASSVMKQRGDLVFLMLKPKHLQDQ